MTYSTYTRTEIVEALQVTDETPEAELLAFAPDYRVPAWMRHANGWLVRDPGTTNVGWVPPEAFATRYRLHREEVRGK